MTSSEKILEVVQEASYSFSIYSNVLIKGDSDFEELLNLFNINEDVLDDIYLVAYKRLDDINFRLLLVYDELFCIDNFSLANADGFDKAINTGKQILGNFIGNFRDDKPKVENNFEEIAFNFSDVAKAYYVKQNERIVVKFKDHSRPIYIDINNIKEKGNNHRFFEEIANLIMSISTAINKEQKKEKDFDRIFDGLARLSEEGDYEQLNIYVDELLDKRDNDESDMVFLYHSKVEALSNTKQYKEAKKYIDLTYQTLDLIHGGFSELENWDYLFKMIYISLKASCATADYYLGDYEKSIWGFNDAYHLDDFSDRKGAYKNNRDEALEKLLENFSELDFYKRKVIFIESDLPICKPNSILPLKIDKLGNLKFPPSHPVEGELYVAHPFQTNVYFPIENHEQILFESQFVELNHLLQCLGATEIRCEHMKGALMLEDTESVSVSSADTSRSANGDVGSRLFSVNAKYDDKSSSLNRGKRNYSDKNSSGKRLMSVQQFSPKISPFIPDDLIWYDHNETWQKLAQQRMQGGLNYYELTISTNSVRVINEREKSKIKSDYKQLISAGLKRGKLDLSGSWEYDKHGESENEFLSSLEKQETNEWKLIVNFAPVEELVSETISLDTDIHNTPVLETAEYSENELKYIDDIKFAIEDDGIIDDDERRMLERNQARYKISEERAKELEDEVLKQNEYTAEELEFIEELNFILDHDGDIDDGDRRILLRLASRLDITEQRAKELEEGVLMSREASTEFTEQEQQYIEELNFCLEEGPEISRSARRLLDRVVVSLGISEARAREIEEEIQAK